MVTSAHSTPELPSLQAPDLTPGKPSYTVHALDTQAWLEGWANLVRVSSRQGVFYQLQVTGGRRTTTKGRMGARQAARVAELMAHARAALVAAAVAAGWSEPIPNCWTPPLPQAPSAPQPPQEAPQEAPQAQEAPQEAPSTPAASLLPWQGGGYVSATSRLWTLDLDQLATLKLYYHERSGRYEWLIALPKSLTILAASGGPGHACYSRAERAMLTALARVLHPPRDLPAYLPPQGGISVARREG